MKDVVLLILILFVSGCSSTPLAVRHSVESQKTGANHVYVASHGWHTGFIIPAPQLQGAIPELKQRFDDVAYIEIGWGDKGFYQAKKITAGLTVRAIFWPTEAVIHCVAIPTDPEDFFSTSDVERLCLSDGELSSLIRFISESFSRDHHGNVKPSKNGLYGDSQFYKGVGDYHLMNTCNKWTAKGIESAGMDISPTFKLSAGSVMDYIRGSQAVRDAVGRNRP